MSVLFERRTTLRIFDEDSPQVPLREVTESAEIARELAAIGVRFERFPVDVPVPSGDDAQAILGAQRSVMEHVQRDGGYGTVDVVRVDKGQSNVESLRNKFLAEHTHDDDEVRYFVAGTGAFYLRTGCWVYQAICVRGDLLFVPAGARHWFDMGPAPEFIAIRWFNDPDGWVGRFTGDRVAERFPLYD